MSTSPSAPEELLPLSPAVYHILVALAEGELHGYAIMQDVAETTGGQIKMGPGTLYGTLKRMLEAGLIEESGERRDPRRVRSPLRRAARAGLCRLKRQCIR